MPGMKPTGTLDEAQVFGIVWVTWMLNRDQMSMGRMKGVPSHREEAEGAAASAVLAWRAFLKKHPDGDQKA